MFLISTIEISKFCCPGEKGRSAFAAIQRFLLILALLVAVPGTSILAQNDTPCECSQRWDNASKWNLDGTVNDNPPNNAEPYGIVGCGAAPHVQQHINVEYNCHYNPSAFLIDVESTNPCTDPLNQMSNPVNPTPGKPIIWFNFDTRAGATHFMAQWNDNGAADDIAWVLYYSNTHQSGTGAAPHYSSGDCSDLIKWSCGVESGNTFYMVEVPIPTNQPYNWYLAIWDQTGDDDLSLSQFKARYGCDLAVPCFIVDCPNQDGGTYGCVSDIPAAAATVAEFEALGGTVTTTCPGAVSITSNDVQSGSCANGNLSVARTYTLTFTPSNNDPVSVESCTIYYSINDVTGPSITCPSNQSVDCTADLVPPILGVATATDCNGTATPTWADLITPGNCDGNFSIARIWTVLDLCGNSSSCTQTITVTDTHAPTISCPDDVTIECSDSQDPTANPSLGEATASDDCSGATITFADGPHVPGSPSCAGNYSFTRTWTATDGCGNSSSCEQVITVEDTTPPTPFQPANVNNVPCVSAIPCPSSSDPTIASLISQIQSNSTDNCGTITVTLRSATALQTCSDPDGDNIYTFGRSYTFRVADDCGNYADVTVSYSGTCQPICTYTQGAWGNAGGAPGAPVGMTDLNLINLLIGTYGTDYGNGKVLRIGTSANSKYLDIKTGQCVLDLLPGGGNPAPLASVAGCNKNGCARCNATSSDGSLKNNLANNTIALQLNVWYSLVNWDNNPNTNWDLRNESLSCIASIPAEVLTKMAQMGFQSTVGGLLSFTNAYLGGSVSGVSSSFAGNLTNAVTAINERWDNCIQPSNSCSAPLFLVGNLGNPTFHAWKNQQKVNLRWFVRNSQDVDHFVIERSIDGVEYRQIASVLPSESIDLENYVATDDHPEKGINHYQLVIYLKNGEVENTPDVEIEFAKTKPYSLMPNPATTEAWLDLTQLTNRKDVTVTLRNCYGQEVLRMQIDEVRDDFPRLDLNNLKDGMYFVTVKIGREIYSDKLIITRMDR